MAINKYSLSRDNSKQPKPGAQKRHMPDRDYAALIRLVNLYPAINRLLPLEIGAHKTQTIPLRPRLFRFALKVHCRRLEYVTMVSAAGKERYTLDGEPVERVSGKHRKEATIRLRRMQQEAGQIKSKKRPQKRNYKRGSLGDEMQREVKKQPVVKFKKRRRIAVATA